MFAAKSRYGFQRERKKWVANFPQTHVQVVACDTWFHIPEKFPLRDRICWKTLFLGYPICAHLKGHGKCSAMPTLFPSPSGHPTDLSFRGDFCWGMYRFPPIHLRKWPFATVSAMGIPGWGHSSATWQKAGHYSIGLSNMKKHDSPGGATIGCPSGIADMQWYNNPLHIF